MDLVVITPMRSSGAGSLWICLWWSPLLGLHTAQRLQLPTPVRAGRGQGLDPASVWWLGRYGGLAGAQAANVCSSKTRCGRRRAGVFPNAAFCEANPLDEWNFELRTNYILVRHPLMYLKVRKIKM